jgi:hypothetical protein
VRRRTALWLPGKDTGTDRLAHTVPTGKESPYTEPAGRNPVEHFQPYSAQLQEYGAWIMASLPKFIQQTSVYKDELTLYVAPSAIVPVMYFLRDHTNTQFKQVMDICGADYPTRAKRFEVVYHLLSIRHQSRIRVKTYADETSPVPSIVKVFRGADWSVLARSLVLGGRGLTGMPAGTSVRRGTCTASTSPATPTSVASSPTTASRATRSARTSL